MRVCDCAEGVVGCVELKMAFGPPDQQGGNSIDSGHFSGRFCGQFWGRFLGHYSIHDITSYFGTDNLFKCHLWPLLVQLLGPPFVTFFGSKSLLNCHQFKHDLRHCLVPDSDAARALSPRGRIPVPAFDDEVYAKGCLKGLDFAR